MKTIIASLAGLAIGASSVLLMISRDEHRGEVIFPQLMFVNFGDGFLIEGSIVGDGDNRPLNNHMRLECQLGDQYCELYSINQIGENHVSSIHKDILRIESWDNNVVRLTSILDPSEFDACNYFEIRADLNDNHATYTRIPNPDADPQTCAAFTDDVMNWRIDDSYWHQRLEDRLEQSAN